MRPIPNRPRANYYNKFGLALVLISAFLVLPAKPAWIAFAKRWDDLAAVALALMAYYTKMPYGMGIVALYLLWRLWIEPSQLALKKAAMALLVGMVAVEILRPGINLGYLSEMRLASGASGGALQVKPLIAYSVRLFPELLILVLLPAALAAWAGRITAKQLVFIGCLTGGSLVLRSLSAQGDQLFHAGRRSHHRGGAADVRPPDRAHASGVGRQRVPARVLPVDLPRAGDGGDDAPLHVRAEAGAAAGIVSSLRAPPCSRIGQLGAPRRCLVGAPDDRRAGFMRQRAPPMPRKFCHAFTPMSTWSR